MRAFAANTDTIDLGAANSIFEELEQQARDDLTEEGFSPEDITVSRFADAKYPNQVHELTIPLPSQRKINKDDLPEIAETFHALHERMFSYCVRDSSVDLYHWRVTATGKIPTIQVQEYEQGEKDPAVALKATREVYFSHLKGYTQTNIYDGEQLGRGMVVEGPAVIEQQNTTIVVSPEQSLEVNRFGDYVLHL
jgi:N-methylhydantoinase A